MLAFIEIHNRGVYGHPGKMLLGLIHVFIHVCSFFIRIDTRQEKYSLFSRHFQKWAHRIVEVRLVGFHSSAA